MVVVWLGFFVCWRDYKGVDNDIVVVEYFSVGKYIL